MTAGGAGVLKFGPTAQAASSIAAAMGMAHRKARDADVWTDGMETMRSPYSLLRAVPTAGIPRYMTGESTL